MGCINDLHMIIQIHVMLLNFKNDSKSLMWEYSKDDNIQFNYEMDFYI